MAQLRSIDEADHLTARAEEICASLRPRRIRNDDLPPDFFIRLLYQESSLRPYVISSAGASASRNSCRRTANERASTIRTRYLRRRFCVGALLRDRRESLAISVCSPPPLITRGQTHSGLAREQGSAAAGDTGLCTKHHKLARRAWTGSHRRKSAVKLPQQAPCQELAGLPWNGPDAHPMPAPNPLVIVARQVKLANWRNARRGEEAPYRR